MEEESSAHPLAWFAGGLSFFLLVYALIAFFDTTDAKLQQAYTSYLQGEAATTVSERKEAFNRALSIYLKLEQTYQPSFGNGKLYYNLGNTYFQLEEYPLAIWSYSKAKALMPRQPAVQKNLLQAHLKTGTTPPSHEASLFQKVFLDHILSLPERLQILGLLLAVFLILLSCRMWLQYRWINSLLIPVVLLFALFFASALKTQFYDPSEAIVLNGTFLYRDAGIQYAKVMEAPLKPGTKVEILQAVTGGRWIKITTPEGVLGYVSYENLKLI